MAASAARHEAKMGMEQELCSEMLLLAGKLWPPSLHWDEWHWGREKPKSWGQGVSAGETTDVRVFWAWCGGQDPEVLYIQLDVGSSSKNGMFALKLGVGPEHVLGELGRVLKKNNKLKPPPPKCSGVGGSDSS